MSIIKTFISNDDQDIYALTFSREVSAGTIEKIFALLFKEEVSQEQIRTKTSAHSATQTVFDSSSG